jgi:hypothetical protein
MLAFNGFGPLKRSWVALWPQGNMGARLHVKGGPEFKLIIHSHPQYDGESFSKKT